MAVAAEKQATFVSVETFLLIPTIIFSAVAAWAAGRGADVAATTARYELQPHIDVRTPRTFPSSKIAKTGSRTRSA